jgi:hypothetical protein
MAPPGLPAVDVGRTILPAPPAPPALPTDVDPSLPCNGVRSVSAVSGCKCGKTRIERDKACKRKKALILSAKRSRAKRNNQQQGQSRCQAAAAAGGRGVLNSQSALARGAGEGRGRARRRQDANSCRLVAVDRDSYPGSRSSRASALTMSLGNLENG